MKKFLKEQRGFTLIELIMVIVILGILAAVAIPTYVNLKSKAQEAAEEGVVGGVRAAISVYYASTAAGGTAAYPTNLDSVSDTADADKDNAYFDTILQTGITSEWTKSGDRDGYVGPNSGYYKWNSTTGKFLEQ